jgi:hypothetical protein
MILLLKLAGEALLCAAVTLLTTSARASLSVASVNGRRRYIHTSMWELFVQVGVDIMPF